MMRRPPLIGDTITFGKHKGRSIHDTLNVNTSYIRWFIGAREKEGRTADLGPWREELARRISPPKLSLKVQEGVWEPIDDDYRMMEEANRLYEDNTQTGQSTGNLLVYTKIKVAELIDAAYRRGMKQAEDKLFPRIQAATLIGDLSKQKLRDSMKMPATTFEKSDVTVFLTKEQVEELIVQSVSLGYSDTYERLGTKIKSFRYSDVDNGDLYSVLILDKAVKPKSAFKEPTDFDDRKCSGTVQDRRDRESKNAPRKSWHAEDNRRAFRFL